MYICIHIDICRHVYLYLSILYWIIYIYIYIYIYVCMYVIHILTHMTLNSNPSTFLPSPRLQLRVHPGSQPVARQLAVMGHVCMYIYVRLCTYRETARDRERQKGERQRETERQNS